VAEDGADHGGRQVILPLKSYMTIVDGKVVHEAQPAK
jgi:hypothetical protein